jgi:ADP-ribose pyrophosphatase
MKVLYELPGGFANPTERVEDTMARELLEETGLAGQLQKVATCIDDAYSTVLRHCFVATDCLPVQSPRHETTEIIKIEYVSLTDFRALLRSGQMTDVEAGYIGLDHLGLL